MSPRVDEVEVSVAEALEAGRGALIDDAPGEAVTTSFEPVLPVPFRVATWSTEEWSNGGPWSWRAVEVVADSADQANGLRGAGEHFDSRGEAKSAAKEWIVGQLERRRSVKRSTEVEEIDGGQLLAEAVSE